MLRRFLLTTAAVGLLAGWTTRHQMGTEEVTISRQMDS
jgi:hypothetical protein